MKQGNLDTCTSEKSFILQKPGKAN